MIDLHVHLDGSLSPDLIRSLAQKQGVCLPDPLSPHIQASPHCQDLNEYLRCFDLPLLLLQTPQNMELAVRDLIGRLHAQGLWYAEIRFAPQLHTREHYSQEDILKGALSGLADAPFPVCLILCCMRGEGNERENLETLRLASLYLDKGVCALDLAGAEGLYPTGSYEDLFGPRFASAPPGSVMACACGKTPAYWKKSCPAGFPLSCVPPATFRPGPFLLPRIILCAITFAADFRSRSIRTT